MSAPRFDTFATKADSARTLKADRDRHIDFRQGITRPCGRIEKTKIDDLDRKKHTLLVKGYHVGSLDILTTIR
jgi:hypothetical protein